MIIEELQRSVYFMLSSIAPKVTACRIQDVSWLSSIRRIGTHFLELCVLCLVPSYLCHVLTSSSHVGCISRRRHSVGYVFWWLPSERLWMSTYSLLTLYTCRYRIHNRSPIRVRSERLSGYAIHWFIPFIRSPRKQVHHFRLSRERWLHSGRDWHLRSSRWQRGHRTSQSKKRMPSVQSMCNLPSTINRLL